MTDERTQRIGELTVRMDALCRQEKDLMAQAEEMLNEIRLAIPYLRDVAERRRVQQRMGGEGIPHPLNWPSWKQIRDL